MAFNSALSCLFFINIPGSPPGFPNRIARRCRGTNQRQHEAKALNSSLIEQPVAKFGRQFQRAASCLQGILAEGATVL
jgi:hypothetical protein